MAGTHRCHLRESGIARAADHEPPKYLNTKKGERLRLPALKLFKEAFQPLWVIWVIALKQDQPAQQVSALTQASTVVLNSFQLRRRVDESSFIPRFIPKLGQAVQEAAMGKITASLCALARVGTV